MAVISEVSIGQPIIRNGRNEPQRTFYLQESFRGINVSNPTMATLNTNRYWYVFGGLKFDIAREAMRVTGRANWSGFGVDTNRGINGKHFDATGCQFIEFEAEGKRTNLKLEITDFNGNQDSLWFTVDPSNKHQILPFQSVSGKISKIQFLAESGSIDVTIREIGFSKTESAKIPRRTRGETSDSIRTPNPLRAASHGDRYAQALDDLFRYFLTNSGHSPAATILDEETDALAAYHVRENAPTHLHNGEATTSETQELFYNLMVLCAVISDNAEPMKQAWNFISRHMMPHHPNFWIPGLANKDYNPYLVHWLIDLSGKGRPGAEINGVFGPRVLYNMYDPTSVPSLHPYSCLPYNGKSQTFVLDRPLTGSDSRYKFSAAMDADQWVVKGLYWANQFGLAETSETIVRFRTAMEDVLRPEQTDQYPNTMRFGRYWGATLRENSGWRDTGEDIYAGYQDPAAWELMGRPLIAQDIVNFLFDSQLEFRKRHRELGPFMPVWSERQGFSWQGADPNTHWAGFQYRAFAHLAYYWYLTGDAKAQEVLENFYTWLNKNSSKRFLSSQISIPLFLGDGKIDQKGYSPNHHGLVSQGLVAMAARESRYVPDAKRFLDDLSLNRRNELGSYTDKDGLTYGFHNAEVGIAYALHQLLIS
jgi:hypothetical protein